MCFGTRNRCGNWKTTSSRGTDEEELELLEDDELEDDGALLEESGGSGAEELCQELEDELLERRAELPLGLGSNPKRISLPRNC
ncbi:MAG: hypothetical protein ACLT8E_01320 [Akkermansia sp.]